MLNRKGFFRALALGFLVLPAIVSAQNSSINAYSPYSFFGLGDFSTQGTANLRAMGGAGVAYREATTINYMNPASYSSIRRKSALFNVGLEGQNFYLKNSDTKSSFNTFNIRDVAFAIPLAGKLGMGISVTPLSSVGYKIENKVIDPNIGQIAYLYNGEGDVVQAKLGVGYELYKNLSIGAELVYYFGSIDRYSMWEITELNGSETYDDGMIYMEENYSKLLYSFGLQYNIPLLENKRALTLGATFQPETKLNPKVIKSVPTSDNNNDFGDYVLYEEYRDKDLTMPAVVAAGAYYHTTKISIGADYVYQGWKGVNKEPEGRQYSFRNTSTIRGGIQYTPDRGDIRNLINRITYRAGVRYSDYYLTVKGQEIEDKAITLGLGIPFKRSGFSNLDLGVELGQMGTTKNNLIKETYFRFSIGLSLFGDDFWFVKPKYD